MGDRKINFISITSTCDEEPSVELQKELEKYIQWLQNKFDDKSIIYTSPSIECVRSGLILNSHFKKKLKVVSQLFEDRKNYIRLTTDEEYIPKFTNLSQKDLFINFLKGAPGNHLVILEKQTYLSFGLEENNHRSQNLSSMHEINLNPECDKNEEQKVIRVEMAKLAEQMRRDLTKCLNERILNETIGIQIFEEIKQLILEISKNLVAIFDILKQPLKNSGLLKKSMKNIENVIDYQRDQINALDENISQYEGLQSSSKSHDPGKKSVEIRRLYFDYLTEDWVLKLRSCTHTQVKNVYIYFYETSECICKIKILQSNSVVTRHVKLNNPDLYSLHLVATHQGKPISEVFQIVPFHISIDKTYESNPDTGLNLKIYNYSFNDESNVLLVSSISNKALARIDTNTIKSQPQFLSILPDQVPSLCNFFLVSGYKIVSNTVIYQPNPNP